jgi:hypothetical protein
MVYLHHYIAVIGFLNIAEYLINKCNNNNNIIIIIINRKIRQEKEKDNENLQNKLKKANPVKAVGVSGG